MITTLLETAYGDKVNDDQKFGEFGSAKIKSPATYTLINKKSGKAISTHPNAPAAVKERNRIGGNLDTHSIVKNQNESSEVMTESELNEAVAKDNMFNLIRKCAVSENSHQSSKQGVIAKFSNNEKGKAKNMMDNKKEIETIATHLAKAVKPA